MDRWTEFVYREFYDVPRMIVVRILDHHLLFVSRFLEARDEYDTEYTCYLLPGSVELEGSWEHLEQQALSVIGRVPVDRVRFDPTRRRTLDLASTGIALPE